MAPTSGFSTCGPRQNEACTPPVLLEDQDSMPEFLALVLVVAVSAGIYLAARIHTSRKTRRSVAELDQLHRWTTERLQEARRENWDPQMIARLHERLKGLENERAANVEA